MGADGVEDTIAGRGAVGSYMYVVFFKAEEVVTSTVAAGCCPHRLQVKAY